jgi:hypothetical protein
MASGHIPDEHPLLNWLPLGPAGEGVLLRVLAPGVDTDP